MSTLLNPGVGLLDNDGTLLNSGAGLAESTAGPATHEGSGALALPLLTASGAGKKERAGSGALELPLLTAAGAGTWHAPNTSLLVSFDTPPQPLTTGADLQAFRVLVRKTDTATPTVTIALYEDGALVATLVTAQNVTSATGEVVTATWDAADLTDPTGADVQCYVYGESNGASQVEIGAVAWDAHTAGVGAATLPVLTLSGAGTKERKGSGALTLPLIALSGAGQSAAEGAGAGDLSLPLLTLSGTGTITPEVTHEGSGALALPLLTLAGTGNRPHAGSGELTLPLIALDGYDVAVPETPVAEQPTGGWADFIRREQATERRKRKYLEELREQDEREEREARERRELAREIAELETHLVEQGALDSVSRETELLRLRQQAELYSDLPNRAARALAYAERARTEAALILAQREMQKLYEEEEAAVLMTLALMD